MKLVCMILILMAIYYLNNVEASHREAIKTVTFPDKNNYQESVMTFSIGFMDPSTFDQSYNRN
jgi:hypothetical protein